MKNFLKRNKIVIFSFCIIFILVFCYVYRTQAFTYESLDFKYGKVKTKSTLNVRCGPGTNYERVGKLKDGEYINVFAKVGDWYIVQTDSNVVGAVSSKYVEPVYDQEEKESESTVETMTSQESNGEYIDSLELTLDELEFLNLINSNRKNSGLPELKIDNAIQNVARLKAQDLERNGYFSHNSPSYGMISDMLTSFGTKFTIAEENIAGNQTLAGAIEAWMNSENHRSNILNKDFEYTGVAIVESSTYGKIFVEVFVKK